MSADAPSITAEQFTELRDGMTALGEAVAELREANTTRERQDAAGDVREAKADLEKLAREAGISTATLEKAMGEAKRAERKDELRPIITELIAELKDGDDKPKDDKTPPAKDDKTPPAKDDKTPPAKDDKAPPAADTEPVVEHWGDRKVSALLR